MVIETAYSLPAPSYNKQLTEVGRGTPMGELLRRYWHPVGLVSDATETPKKVKVLGEDLILFRDKLARPGLVYPRCVHRGASLYYGRVEEKGLRCCYHGWVFDVEGQCVEMPCEPEMGRGICGKVRQPHYPLEERYGLIFAYMGPPERKPLLPRYDILENLESDEFIEADDTSIGSGGPVIVPCNWLQHYENVMDPFHVPILHNAFSGMQFIEKMGLMPKATFDYTSKGLRSTQLRQAGSVIHKRITEVILPTIRAVASPRREEGGCSLLGWVLPIDDTTFRVYSAGKVREAGELAKIRSHFNGKLWHELTEEEHQKFPGDYEAHVSQGKITFHSEEHLTSTDEGVAKLRRAFKKQFSALEKGEDPIGVYFDTADELVRVEAGSSVKDGAHDSE